MNTEKKYSFKKGLIKGAISLLSIVGAGLAFTTFSDVTLVELIEKYIFPVLGSVTVGGAITIAVNWLKVRNSA